MNGDSVLSPSANTKISTLAGFAAATLMWWLGQKKIFFPAGYEALLSGAIGVVAGYLTEVCQALLKKLRQ